MYEYLDNYFGHLFGGWYPGIVLEAVESTTHVLQEFHERVIARTDVFYRLYSRTSQWLVHCKCRDTHSKENSDTGMDRIHKRDWL